MMLQVFEGMLDHIPCQSMQDECMAGPLQCACTACAALKSKGMGFASFLREKTSAASESLKQRDWTREQQALSSLKTWGTGWACSSMRCMRLPVLAVMGTRT